MSLLQRYILKKFLVTFIGTMLFLVGIFILVRTMEMLDTFLLVSSEAEKSSLCDLASRSFDNDFVSQLGCKSRQCEPACPWKCYRSPSGLIYCVLRQAVKIHLTHSSFWPPNRYTGFTKFKKCSGGAPNIFLTSYFLIRNPTYIPSWTRDG